MAGRNTEGTTRSLRAPYALLVTLILIAQLACNSTGSGTPDARPVATNPSAVSQTVGAEVSVASTTANTLVTITAQVPAKDDACDCDTTPLERLVGDLKDAQLDEGFKEVSTSDAVQVFSITYDPAQVPSERVADLIARHGGTILRGPAPAQEVYSTCQCGLEAQP